MKVAGRLLANVLASVSGLRTAASRHRCGLGRWKVLGRLGEGRLLSATAEQVAAVRRLHGEGEKIARIARAVGLSRPTIYRLLAS